MQTRYEKHVNKNCKTIFLMFQFWSKSWFNICLMTSTTTSTLTLPGKIEAEPTANATTSVTDVMVMATPDWDIMMPKRSGNGFSWNNIIMCQTILSITIWEIACLVFCYFRIFFRNFNLCALVYSWSFSVENNQIFFGQWFFHSFVLYRY